MLKNKNVNLHYNMYNINPKLWGRSTWDTIFYFLAAYPKNPSKEEINVMYDYILLLRKILPCSKCRENYRKNLKKYPVSNSILSNKKKLINWFINIKRQIASKNGKKDNLNYDKVISKYLYGK